jgi:hypothetical protein
MQKICPQIMQIAQIGFPLPPFPPQVGMINRIYDLWSACGKGKEKITSVSLW